jgi:uncharacterized protein (TIGR02271 family)
MTENRNDGFTALEERFAGYTVYDKNHEKLGRVDDLFVNESDEPEYIGVKMGFFGTRSTLVPMDIVRVNDERELVEVAAEKERVKDAPNFDDDREITPDFERQVREYYGVGAADGERSGYGAYYADRTGDGDVDLQPGERAAETGQSDREEEGAVGPGMAMGDTETGEFRGHARESEGVNQPGSDLEDEDELRVQRSEEELRAGTREREAGAMNVRKRVRTDREQMSVPKKREEVKVDRVPASGEASETEIGEDEIRMPVTEEEVVVEKRPVVKEEIRVRKETVEEEELVEEEVRKEEIEVDDATERGLDDGTGRDEENRL